MGEIIRFPDEVNPRGRYVDANTEPATVIILPVIGNTAGRRRRRRAVR
jgi:hypothetical protein